MDKQVYSFPLQWPTKVKYHLNEIPDNKKKTFLMLCLSLFYLKELRKLGHFHFLKEILSFRINAGNWLIHHK